MFLVNRVILVTPKWREVWSIKLETKKRKASLCSALFSLLGTYNIHIYFPPPYMIYPSRHLDAVLISLSSLRADPAYEAINIVGRWGGCCTC